jgi:hypothetical protein
LILLRNFLRESTENYLVLVTINESERNTYSNQRGKRLRVVEKQCSQLNDEVANECEGARNREVVERRATQCATTT